MFTSNPLRILFLFCSFSIQLWGASQTQLYNGNDFWAKVDITQDSSGKFYAMHKTSENYYFYTLNGSSWSLITTLTPAALSLYKIGENTDMELSSDDKIHLVFDGCDSITASSCNPYYINYNGTWSAKELIIDTPNAPKELKLIVEDNGVLHVSYIYSNKLNYISKTDATWPLTAVTVETGTTGIDEIVKQWLTVASDSTASIFYVRENNQNIYEGNLYSKSSLDGFISSTKVIDAVSLATPYNFNDVYLDSLDRIHLNYTTLNSGLNESYMYHAQSSPTGFIETKIGSDTLFERGIYHYVNDILYMLVIQSNLDYSSKNLYIATNKNDTSWTLGKTLGITDIAANEITFSVSSNNNMIILFEDSGLDTVNYYSDSVSKTAFLPALYHILLN